LRLKKGATITEAEQKKNTILIKKTCTFFELLETQTFLIPVEPYLVAQAKELHQAFTSFFHSNICGLRTTFDSLILLLRSWLPVKQILIHILFLLIFLYHYLPVNRKDTCLQHAWPWQKNDYYILHADRLSFSRTTSLAGVNTYNFALFQSYF